MKATPARDAQAANDAPTNPAEESPTAPATDAAALVRAWTRLLDLELNLARRSLRWLLIGAIAVPVIGLSAWLGLSVLLVVFMQAYTQSWLLASLFGAGVQFLVLALLFHQLHRWAHDLSLPQSRAALARAMEKMS
jgi:hypothetical protein